MNEFKGRVLSSVMLFFLTFSISYSYSDELITYIIANLINGAFPIITVSPLETLYSKFYISSIFSIIITLPLLITNLYFYIKPALYKKEIKTVKIVIFPCMIAFLLGFIGFSLVGIEWLVYFISTLGIVDVTNSVSLIKIIHFVTCCCAVSGIMCCYPIFIYLISYIGLVNRDTLKRYRKHTVVIAFVLGALVTPPDIITQCILAVPLIALHELSILLIRG